MIIIKMRRMRMRMRMRMRITIIVMATMIRKMTRVCAGGGGHHPGNGFGRPPQFLPVR